MKNARPPAMFVAESRGLDFLNSIATPLDEAVEFIGSGEDFLQWLREAELVPAEILASLRNRAAPGELDVVAAQARVLREWFRGFVDQFRGKPLPAFGNICRQQFRNGRKCRVRLEFQKEKLLASHLLELRKCHFRSFLSQANSPQRRHAALIDETSRRPDVD